MALRDVISRLSVVLSLDAGEFLTGSTNAQQSLRAVAEKFTNLGRTMTEAGKSVTKRVTLPLVGIGAAVVKVAADFESGMGRVQIATEATAKEMEQMRVIAIRIGNDTTFGASEAASAMEMLAKAGIDTKTILGGAAKAVTDLAAAAGSGLDPAASAISDSINQFHLAAKDLPTIVNQITGAVNESKFEFSDFTGGMAQAGGVAASAGVSFKDFAATLAATSSQFASGSDAGTSFKTFLLSLQPATKKAAALFEKFGLNFYDATGQMKSMAEVAEILRQKFAHLSDEQRNAALEGLFGTDAIRTAVGLMNQGAAGIERITLALANTKAAEQAAKRMAGFSGQIEQLKGAFETLAIAIADTGLLTAVTTIVKHVANFVSWLAQAHPTVMKVVVAIAALAAAMGPLMIVMGTLAATVLPFFLVRMGLIATVIATIINPLGTAIALFGRLAAGLLATSALRLAFLALSAAIAPALIPLAAIAAVAALIYVNWDKIAPLLDEFWATVQRTLGPALQELVKAVGALFTELTEGALGKGIRQAIKALIELNNATGKALGPAFVVVVKLALDTVVELVKVITDGVRLVTGILKGDWELTWKSALAVAERAMLGIPALVARMVAAVREWLVGKLGPVWQLVVAGIERVKKAFKDAYDAIVGNSYVPDMVDEIAAQMLRLDTVMVGKAKSAADQTKAVFKKLRDDLEPLLSRLFPEAAALNALRNDRKVIDQGLKDKRLTPEQAAELHRRASLEGHQSTIGDRLEGGDPLGVWDWDQIQIGLSKVTGVHTTWANKAEAVNVRVVESFKDMADNTLAALDRMAGAIRGGGFLDILSSVIGLGMQLGSIGVFGKKVQTNINLPRHARGTNFAPGGLSVVGERGPELVNLRRGSSVTPNHKLTRGGNTYYISGNLLTPEFWQQIQAGDMAAVQGGAAVAHAQQARSRKWRLA